MSTHTLDASGARPLSTTVNDPARTTATVQAKQGDDCVVTLGNFARVEIPIPTTPGAARIVTRVRSVRKAKRDDHGNHLRDENRNLLYEDAVEETKVLVFDTGHLMLSAHTEKGDGYPSTPHTTCRVVNLENDQSLPLWVQGETGEDEPVDLGFGTEKPE